MELKFDVPWCCRKSSEICSSLIQNIKNYKLQITKKIVFTSQGALTSNDLFCISRISRDKLNCSQIVIFIKNIVKSDFLV
jgi:hypothetical protein